MKLTWLTDIHLNFLDYEQRIDFYQEILQSNADVVLISGDIAEAPSVVEILKEMVGHIQKPIYFVLGNHDYYKSEVAKVRDQMITLTQQEKLLFWLPASGCQILEENVILVGQDGWADGRYGDFFNSRVSVSDSRMITDLFQQKILGKNHLLEKMQQLADADAKQLQVDLEKAVSQKPKKVIVLTHVPPFREACLHQGKISNDEWLPYFTSKATGDVLMQVAEKNQMIEFLILCGHTHDGCIYMPLNNLTVKTRKAEYYRPTIESFSLENMLYANNLLV